MEYYPGTNNHHHYSKNPNICLLLFPLVLWFPRIPSKTLWFTETVSASMIFILLIITITAIASSFRRNNKPQTPLHCNLLHRAPPETTTAKIVTHPFRNGIWNFFVWTTWRIKTKREDTKKLITAKRFELVIDKETAMVSQHWSHMSVYGGLILILR